MAKTEIQTYQKLPISYPYVASVKRTDDILKSWKLIKLKMTPNEVLDLMGLPDEIRPLHSPQKKGSKLIGKTYWYLIQQLSENGSQKDKNEKLVRISFDLNNQVVKIDHWGFKP